MQHNIHPEGEKIYVAESCPVAAWSIMALTLENENYIYTYEDHLDNNIIINSIGVW